MLVHRRVISSTFTPVLIHTAEWKEKFLALSLFKIFVARRGTLNFPLGYWRSQLRQDHSPVHGADYVTAHRKTGDENLTVLRNATALSAVYFNFHFSVLFLPIFGWDMMKNLNDMSTLGKISAEPHTSLCIA